MKTGSSFGHIAPPAFFGLAFRKRSLVVPSFVEITRVEKQKLRRLGIVIKGSKRKDWHHKYVLFEIIPSIVGQTTEGPLDTLQRILNLGEYWREIEPDRTLWGCCLGLWRKRECKKEPVRRAMKRK